MHRLVVGTGALTMPAAFGHAGWLLSLVIVVLLCIMRQVVDCVIA